MAPIGPRPAVGRGLGGKVTGRLPYVMCIFRQAMHPVGWGNRRGPIYTWAPALGLSHNRGNRIIALDTARQDVDAGHAPVARPPAILPRTTQAPVPGVPDAEETIPSTPREADSA